MNDELPTKKETEEKKEGRKYCAHCEQEIPPGKEIKVSEYLGSPNYWYTPRYYWRTPWVVRVWEGGSAYPVSQSVYYLCLPCHKWYQRMQNRRRNREKWSAIIPFFLIFSLVIFVILLTAGTIFLVSVRN